MTWRHNKFFFFSKKICHTIMRHNDIIKLNQFSLWIVEDYLLSAWHTQEKFLSNNSLLRDISAKICLFLDVFTFELTQRETPRNAELCASFQNCSPIKQLCLDLDLAEKNCLASILLLRFLESYAKACSKIVKSSSEIADNQSLWPIFCVKRNRSWYWNGWGTTIFRLT